MPLNATNRSLIIQGEISEFSNSGLINKEIQAPFPDSNIRSLIRGAIQLKQRLNHTLLVFLDNNCPRNIGHMGGIFVVRNIKI